MVWNDLRVAKNKKNQSFCFPEKLPLVEGGKPTCGGSKGRARDDDEEERLTMSIQEMTSPERRTTVKRTKTVAEAAEAQVFTGLQALPPQHPCELLCSSMDERPTSLLFRRQQQMQATC
ncbi:hypothetical protein EUGRSUZ_E00172 [Eucalyptus grandis]|uniref:Uncharacterized protein n=2 Tax=Eucalyptus grandis TaxID=71139 RepID=A0ACC3KQS0_EUCGR|nr:hypothetical protein EUGRSUZ_E00172 [Eucalyptus grandis]